MPCRAASSLVVLVLSLPALAQGVPQAADPLVAEPKTSALGVEITYLANAGFYLESGGHSVLIDSFLLERIGPYAALPSEGYKQLVNALPPFNEPTIVLVSHSHQDHVQMRSLEKYLKHNEQARLLTSPQVIGALKEEARAFASIEPRVTPVITVPGQPRTLAQEGEGVTFLELHHGGKGNERITNLGHLFTLGGLRILHVGDAEPTLVNFAPYNLSAQHLDIVFVPYWYFGAAEGARVLQEQVHARIQIVCHVPPAQMEEFDALRKEKFPDVILFKEALEKRSFLPAGAEATPKPGGDGTEGKPTGKGG